MTAPSTVVGLSEIAHEIRVNYVVAMIRHRFAGDAPDGLTISDFLADAGGWLAEYDSWLPRDGDRERVARDAIAAVSRIAAVERRS